MAPMSHDEDQYVAAAMLARSLRPFVDFMHMQTPLQADAFRYVAAAFPGHAFMALRLANAACALGILALVQRAQRQSGVGLAPAWVATLSLAGCASFGFIASVARNDALPALLLAAATCIAIAARGRGEWLVAGILLGLASSAKISFAIPAATLGAWLLIVNLRSRAGLGTVFAYGTGGVVGLLPALLTWHAAPEVFVYGVVQFASEAVFDWYRANGLEAKLMQSAKLVALPLFLMQGPGLAASVLVTWRARSLPSVAAPVVALAIGGLAAAAAPTPVWTQYLMTLLPPLFVLTGVTLTGLTHLWRERLCALLVLLAAGGAIGISVAGLLDWLRTGEPAALRVTHEAHWIGDVLRARGVQHGTVTTLTQSVVIDSGFAIDRRFAGGAQLFRSADRRSNAEQVQFHMVGFRTLDAAFAADPPVAIVTGYEGASPVNRRLFPDDALAGWAKAHGYTPILSPIGRATLWVHR
jgi:hypothetical protein